MALLDGWELRYYQNNTIAEARQLILDGKRKIIIQGQTGSGKTAVVAEIFRLARLKGKTCTFWAHNREIIKQTSDTFWQAGVPHAVIMAGEDYDGVPASVTICSKDTLLSRAVRRKNLSFPPADIVAIDEAHRLPGAGYQKLLAAYPDAVILGPTATPCRLDGRKLGAYFDGLVSIVKPSVLIQEGFLVPTIVYAPYRPNLKNVPKRGYDWEPEALEKEMDKPKLIGNVVQHWLRLAHGRQTVVFASSVKHSIHLRDCFSQAGIAAEHLDAQTSKTERDAMLLRLANGETTVLCNVGVCLEGWDCPIVSCVCWVCPTKSFGKFRQGCGRVQRPFPGKDKAILIDHAGSVFEHGFPDDDITWTLEGSGNVHTEVKKALKDGKMKKPILCPHCFRQYSGRPDCPECGHRPKPRGEQAETKHGLLVEVDRDGILTEKSKQSFQRAWSRCLGITANRGTKLSNAAMIFKSITGQFPWEVGSIISPLPENYSDFTAHVYPQYIKKKKVVAGGHANQDECSLFGE